MACVWIEGFETHTNTNQLARKYATLTGSVLAQAGRVFGTSAGPSALVAVTPSFGTDNTIVIGFGARIASHNAAFNSNSQGLYFETGANEQAHVEFESHATNGFRLLIKRGSTTVATSSYFAFAQWHYFEIKLVLRTGTNGAYELRRNGVTDISGSGVNLANNGTDGADVFAWRFVSNFSSLLRLDDIYINTGAGATNNDFLGPQVVEGILPNADGATIQWTQNGAGDHYTSVDDAANLNPDESGGGGTIGSDTNGQIDLFGMQDLQQITGAVSAVQVGVQLGMAAAGTRTVRNKYRDPDTTEANGDSHVVDSTTFDEFTQVYQLNPASSAAWDVADIDDGQFGLEVVS